MVQNQFNMPFSSNQATRNGTPNQNLNQRPSPQAQKQNVSGPPTPVQASQQAQTPQVQNNNQPSAEQRRLNQQLSSIQVDLFMKTLTDYMRARGTPINTIPVVGGRRLHPFFLYAIVARWGGSANVSRQNQWGLVGQKLGLNVDQNPQLIRDLTKVYVDYLYPFEQYASTPEGQRDLQSRRQLLQKQQEAILRQRQQEQQPPSAPAPAPAVAPTPAAAAASAPSPVIQQSPAQQHLPTPSNSAPQVAQVPQPQQSIVVPAQQKQQPVSQHTSQPPTPMAQPPRPVSRDATSPFAQPGARVSVSQQGGSKNNSPLVSNTNVSPSVISRPPSETNVPTQVESPPILPPNIIRNYIPEHRIVDYHGGFDIKVLSQVGEQIDTAKPIFLFAPELGAINIHALTMSLESGCISEVNTALNTILVTSADNGLTIPLPECPEFLDAITTLGLRVLDQLLKGTNERIKAGADDIDIEIITPQASSNIDEVFSKYVKDDEEYDETEIRIDSFSGEPIEETEDSIDVESVPDTVAMDMDEPESNGVSRQEVSSMPPDFNIPEKFEIPSYFEMLTAVRSETEDPFSTIHVRTAEDPQVLLIDQLTTISMILRNISFTDYNSKALAMNENVKDLLFRIIHAIATNGDKFIFTRRRLGFLKDSLIILTNISHLLELRSHNEALCALALVLTFGSDPQTDETMLIPDYVPSTHKYLSHGVDVLTKLLVRDPPNRSLFQAVMTGIYDSSVHPLVIEENKKLVALYTGDQGEFFLISRVFKYLLSVIPFNSLALHPLLQEREAVILQALLSALLVVDMVPTDQLKQNMPLTWLCSTESIGHGLTRLGLLLAPFSAEPNNNDALKQISKRALLLVNELADKALQLIEFLGKEDDKNKLKDIKLHLSPDSILGSMLSTIDPMILDQIMALYSRIERINKSIESVA